MEICKLRAYNDYGWVVDEISFLHQPFLTPLSLKIPKATKRVRETGDNLFRDGSDITSIRYNNAVITMQPRFSFRHCTGQEALEKIEILRGRIDRMLEEARRKSLRGFGWRIEFIEDTKGFALASTIIDGTFDIEESWDWSNVASGVVANSTLNLTRVPFRRSLDTFYLNNYVVNPGFEVKTGTTPTSWTASGVGTLSSEQNGVQGSRCAKMAVTTSGISDGVVTGVNTNKTLVLGTKYYVEAWAAIDDPLADDLLLEVVHQPSGVVAGTITWRASDAAYDPTDKNARRRLSDNNWTFGVGNTLSSPILENWAAKVFLTRKALIFTAITSTASYFVRFRVDKPSRGANYRFDRVLLAPASDLAWTSKQQVTTPFSIDPTAGNNNYKSRFITGWMSGELIANHNDDGTTDHGAGTGYHVNYVDMMDIPGDVPPISRMEVATSQEVVNMYAAMTSHGVQEEFLGTAANAAEFSGSADTAASGGAKTAYASVTSSYSIAGTASKTNGVTISPGNYRLILRLKDTAAVQGNLRVKITALLAGGSFDNTEFTAPSATSTTWSISDAGLVIIPPGYTDLALQETFGSATLSVNVKRITGTNNVELDFFHFFPADEWFAVTRPNVVGGGASVVFQSVPEVENVFVCSSPAASPALITVIPAYDADRLLIVPNREMRFFFLYNRSSVNHILDDTMRISYTFQPRYL